ncbi:2-aminoethylphosphonate--pyruvate transaminase [Salibacterium halotolerans]|uniref:2-aminoethylphosphonate--pyruvate transaminase n=1 Tax=Salibacterium halotolerans TaxID=1884432 RepID=A0A1I5W076_9BACI|nr:2-aminoethylphosphonate--pyruvate transaminase [Salibacterium halotolerans]SFQ13125.1 2-aminoethylphosphonate-pyruvate transaminase [Salibacterium halotolerans]
MKDDHYLLLTPGPLTTTDTVKETMLKDWCTWDTDYNSLVQSIRSSLLHIAGVSETSYTSVLMQGSGTFSVESVITTGVPDDGNLLVIVNGAYGQRIVSIAERVGINVSSLVFEETARPEPDILSTYLSDNPSITHVAVVHCETTTGMLNPINEIASVVNSHNKTFIVDAMSSFGGMDLPVTEMNIDYLISSANKCIQGVPGFGFVLARRDVLSQCRGQARSLSLDLYDQWESLESNDGKWRFTSPTHTVRAFRQALTELEKEGGVQARYYRYHTNQRTLVNGMRKLGFTPLLPDELQSPVITPFYYPEDPSFDFDRFYEKLKSHGFVIYPGKADNSQTFRVGNIGSIYPSDIEELLEAVEKSMYWKQAAL